MDLFSLEYDAIKSGHGNFPDNGYYDNFNKNYTTNCNYNNQNPSKFKINPNTNYYTAQPSHNPLVYSNPNVFRHIQSLEADLSYIHCENSTLLKQLEEINTMTYLNQHIDLMNELVEKKTRIQLLKKEIDVKKTYLQSLARRNKTKLEAAQTLQTERFQKMLQSINSLSTDLNKTVEKISLEGNLEDQTFIMLKTIEGSSFLGLINSK